MPLHISRSNSKLGSQIPSVNLPAGSTCRPDAPCRAKCYALKGRFRFRNVRNAAVDNLTLWNTLPDVYEINIICGIYGSKYFRWHSSGDIPDAAYLDMMFRVARKLPDTKFLCFSKKYELINEKLNTEPCPVNLTLVLSSWGCFVPENPHNLPVAYVRFKDSNILIPDNAYHCTTHCGNCVQTEHSCWELSHGESVFFDEH